MTIKSEKIPLEELLVFDEKYFINPLSIGFVCGGPCTDWTWTINGDDCNKIMKWFEKNSCFKKEVLEKIRDTIQNGGEFPIYPYGLDLKDFMISNFNNPEFVQHGSQGLNAAIQASEFDFYPVYYNHTISRKNIETLEKMNPRSIEVMKNCIVKLEGVI